MNPISPSRRNPERLGVAALRSPGRMVEVLLAVDGHTERWRGEVMRSTHSSVELRPFGCASTIEFEVEQALEIFAWTTKGINAASIASIEQTQAQRLAKRRSGR